MSEPERDNAQILRRRRQITKEQKLKLLQLIKSSPETKMGNHDLAIKRWKEIAQILNSMDDTVTKEWHVWRKSWLDIRTKLRKKSRKVVHNDPDSSIDQYLDEATSNTSFDSEFKNLSDVTKRYSDTSNTLEIQKLDEIETSFTQSIQSTKRNETLKKNNKNVNNSTRKRETFKIEEFFPDSNNFHGFSKLESSSPNKKKNSRDSPPISRVRTKLHSIEKRKGSSFRDSIASYLDRDVKVKEDYYTKKLRLMERTVIANESIASSLRLLTEGRSDLLF